MHSSASDGSDAAGDLVVEIIEALEAYGLDSTQYQLHDFVDVDALERVLSSASGPIEIRFTVEGVRVVVTPDGVETAADTHASSSGQ